MARGPKPFAGPRFPVDELLAVAGYDSYRSLGVALGLSHTTVHVAVRRGGLSERKADEWACKLNLHPGEVWGRLWWELAA